MFDRKHIGHVFPPFVTKLEYGRISLFSKAIGKPLGVQPGNPSDERPSIVIPLTFPTAILMDAPNPDEAIELLGLEAAWILHAEEDYEYFAPILVGDTISTQTKIVDVYERRGGNLRFVGLEMLMSSQDGAVVCKVRRTLVVQDPSLAKAS